MLVGIIPICTHSRIHSSEKLGRLRTERKVGDLCFERHSVHRCTKSRAGHGAATSAAGATPRGRGAEGLRPPGVMGRTGAELPTRGFPGGPICPFTRPDEF